MTITLTWQTLLTAFGVLGAAVGIVAYFAKAVRRVDKWNEQDNKIDTLKDTHDADIKAIKEELRILCKGMHAALQGLSEQGCNGPVTASIKELGDHLNNAAHDK